MKDAANNAMSGLRRLFGGFCGRYEAWQWAYRRERCPSRFVVIIIADVITLTLIVPTRPLSSPCQQPQAPSGIAPLNTMSPRPFTMNRKAPLWTRKQRLLFEIRLVESSLYLTWPVNGLPECLYPLRFLDSLSRYHRICKL